MITIETINKLLTSEEKDNLMRTLSEQGKCFKEIIEIYTFLSSIIGGSINWLKTKEGSLYWNELYEKIYKKGY